MQAAGIAAIALSVIFVALGASSTQEGERSVALVIDMLPGASIAVAVYFGVQGLRAWRAQVVGKRKFEVAEEALVSFARASDALKFVRNIASNSNEGATREKEPDETPDETRRRNANFVPLERLNAASEQFAPLRKTQLLCRYHFGPEAAAQFDAIFSARGAIIVGARMLNILSHSNEPLNSASKEIRDKSERAIWGTGGEEDEIARSIDAAMVRLENICAPYLK